MLAIIACPGRSLGRFLSLLNSLEKKSMFNADRNRMLPNKIVNHFPPCKLDVIEPIITPVNKNGSHDFNIETSMFPFL